MAALRRHLLAEALTLLGAIVLIAAGIAWRLSRGPIDLSFLNAQIEQQLSAIAPGIAAQVQRTEIAWLHHLPEIRVVGVEARHGAAVLLSLPQISIRPSLRALAHGSFAVERVNVAGVQLLLSRGQDGKILLGTANHPAEIPIDLSAFLPAPASDGDARYFKRVRVRNSALRFEDVGSATRWTIEGIHLEMIREVDAFDGTLDARVALESSKGVAIQGLDLPVSMTARLQLGEDGAFGGVRFHVRGADGKLVPAGNPGPALPIRSLVVGGLLSKDASRVDLDQLALGVGGSKVEATASVSASAFPHGLELWGRFKSLSVAELKRLWPRGAAVGAREWIDANIHDGSVPSGSFVIRLPPAGAPPKPLAADAVDVKFEFAGLGVNYYGELDPARDVRGSGVLSAKTFEGHVTKGQVGDLEMQKGRVVIDWGGKVATLEVEADVVGPSAGALAIVDRAPLKVAEKMGVVPQDLGGSSENHVEVSLPLKPALHPRDVRVNVQSSLTDASLEKLVRGIGFRDGTLAVLVNDGNVDVEGSTTFTGIAGPTEPAHAKVSFTPDQNGTESRLQIDIAGKDLSAKASATLNNGAVSKLTVDELRIAGSNLSGVVTNDHGSYFASLRGEMLDFEQFLETRKPNDPLNQLQNAYQADFDFEQVRARLGIELSGVSGHLSGGNGQLRTLQASGVADGGPVHVEYGPRGDKQRLRVQCERAGPLLRGLGIFEEVQGGRVTMVADMGEGGLGSDFDGRLYVRDVKVMRAPVLAKILSLGSLGGIANMLNGEGLEFTRARIPFRWSGTTIEMHDALAVGAIGLTAAGSIDRTKRWIDIRGRVIPAYTLNSALGKVPFIGTYLVGGKGEGVFGIDYSAKGSIEKPELSVNPLSALAPGALRKMFIDPFKSDESENAPPPAGPENNAGREEAP
jgi:hypothetical protein